MATDYSTKLSKNLKQMLDGRRFCDVTVIAEADGKRFAAHRIILCAASDYFKSWFTSPSQREIKLFNFHGNEVENLINYCYTGKLFLYQLNAEKILTCAYLLQMDTAVDECGEFLKTQLNATNCLRMQFFAEQYKCKKLIEYARNYVSQNFAQVTKSEAFFKLNIKQLIDLLSRDNLNMKGQEFAFDCVMLWVQRDKVNRKKFLQQLLPHMRLELMNPQFISDHVEPVCKENGCLQLVCEAYKKKLINTCIKERSGWSIVVFDQEGNFGKYYPDLHEWMLLEDMKLSLIDASCVVWNDKLIAVGGYKVETSSTMKNVQYWDVTIKKWKDLAPLNSERIFTGTCVLGGSLYAVGGCVDEWLDSVERLDTLTGAWTTVAPLPFVLDNVEVVAFDGYIYVEGYYKRNPRRCRYDPKTDEWTKVGKTDGDLRSYIVAKGDLYAFRSDTIQLYNKKTNTWATSPIHNSDIINVSVLGDRIFTINLESYKTLQIKEFDLANKIFTDSVDITWVGNRYRSFFLFAIKNV